MEDEIRVLILGASEGNIGEAVGYALSSSIKVETYDREDFDIAELQLADVIAELKPTHIVYSVGINRLDWLKNIEQGDFEETMRVNVWGFIWLMQELIWASLRDGHPKSRSVVVVTSDAAWRPMRTSLVYCASKTALEMAVKVASRELAAEGWRINAVAPGKVADTPMTKAVEERVLELRDWTRGFAEHYEISQSPIGRAVTKNEVAQVVMSVLFGPTGQTGQVIAVNGGR